MPEQTKEKQLLLLFILIAILSSIVFYQVNAPLNVEKKYAALNFDTFIYMQYAKAFADGHPYQFNESDPPTTGSTSHLYPVILGLFYLVGFKGFALLEVAFWLNVFFFVICVILLWFILAILEPKWRWVIMALFTLSGYVVYAIAGLTDMTLFSVMTFSCWLALLKRRYILTAVILFLLPFTRPEGVIIIGIYLLLLLYEYLRTRKIELVKDRGIAAGAGVSGCLAMFLLNIVLTGMAGLDSTLGKGYFNRSSLLDAIISTISDGLILWKSLFFGIVGSDNSFRQFHFIPVISGVFILYGFNRLLSQKENVNGKRFVELWWLGSLLGGILLVISSGFMNFHIDRYLFWIIPFLMIFMVRGVDTFAIPETMKIKVFTVLIVFQIAAYPFFLKIYLRTTAETSSIVKSLLEARGVLEPNARVGSSGVAGIKYLNPKWHIINVGGVTSPWFRKSGGQIAERIKECQHKPELRFDWLIKATKYQKIIPEIVTDSQIIERPSLFTNPIVLYNVDWDLLIKGDLPLSDSIVQYVNNGVSLIDRVDAAWKSDENRVDLKCLSVYQYSREFSTLTRGKIKGAELIDAVRPVLGNASLVMKTLPGHGHWFVLRTAVDQKVQVQSETGVRFVPLNLRGTKSIDVTVAETAVLTMEMGDLKNNPDEHFFERMIYIPADLITEESTHFVLTGFFLMCDIWLYAESG